MWSTRTLLPIVDLDVTAHEPVTSAGACALLSQTEAIRVMEGGLEVLFSREILRAEAWR